MTGILGFWDSAVLVSGRTRDDIVYSSITRYRPKEPVSVLGSCTGTSGYTGRLERPGYGLRQEFMGVSTPSHHWLSQQISQLCRIRFCYLAYGQECYLILVRHIHSLLHQMC